MVDRSTSGGMPNSAAGGGATFVDLSGNGRYVVFYSTASNLTTTTSRVGGNVFVRDMVLDKTIEAVRSSTGGIANGYSTRPTISGDPDTKGNYHVTYNSKASNLVAGVSGGLSDIYVTQFHPAALTVSTPKLVSRSLSGGASNGINLHAEISSDGGYIAFQGTSSNLTSNDTDTILDVFESANPFLDSTARPELVSVSTAGVKGRAPSGRPAINGNGDEVAFESSANNLVSGDTNAVMNAFLRGTRAGAFIGTGNTIRVSVDYSSCWRPPPGRTSTGSAPRWASPRTRAPWSRVTSTAAATSSSDGRTNALVGWQLLRFTRYDVLRRPAYVVATARAHHRGAA